MRKEVKKWFKQEDLNYPWVKYSIITLLSYINVTIGNGAKDPDNKMALATDIAKYSPVVIKRVRKQVELWETKLFAAISGDEPPITKLYKCTFQAFLPLIHFTIFTFPSHSSHGGLQGSRGQEGGRASCWGRPASPGCRSGPPTGRSSRSRR